MFFLLFIKEHNISNQSSGVIGPIGFLSSSKLMHLIYFLKADGCFDF